MKKKLSVALAITAIAPFGLIACGDDDDESSESGSTETATEETTTEDTGSSGGGGTRRLHRGRGRQPRLRGGLG